MTRWSESGAGLLVRLQGNDFRRPKDKVRGQTLWMEDTYNTSKREKEEDGNEEGILGEMVLERLQR